MNSFLPRSRSGASVFSISRITRSAPRATCLEEEETTLKLLSEVKCNERILLTLEHSKLS